MVFTMKISYRGYRLLIYIVKRNTKTDGLGPFNTCIYLAKVVSKVLIEGVRIKRSLYFALMFNKYLIFCRYLTKDQLKGKSSVEAYISAFKRGCKCVECMYPYLFSFQNVSYFF